MSGYVLVRNSDGKCVARPGLEHSYTHRLGEIWVFKSRAEAARQMCVESESVMPLSWFFTSV